MQVDQPKQIVLDGGPEFPYHVMAIGLKNGVELAFLEKANPHQEALLNGLPPTRDAQELVKKIK